MMELETAGNRSSTKGIEVPVCRHDTLVLVAPEHKVRCRACHLVLTEAELGDSYCPECFEAAGERNYAFEKMRDETAGKGRYVCESCGAFVG